MPRSHQTDELMLTTAINLWNGGNLLLELAAEAQANIHDPHLDDDTDAVAATRRIIADIRSLCARIPIAAEQPIRDYDGGADS